MNNNFVPIGMFWFFLWILFWLVIPLMQRYLYGGRRYRGWWRNSSLPLDILKRRYAMGDIDKQEFEDKKQDLNL